jgi:hypothetical protein
MPALRRLVLVGAAVLALAFVAAPAAAQPMADTLFAWRGYARSGETSVRIYPAPPDEERRTRTIVVQELAENRGPSTVDDARHLAELIGRAFGIDPAEAYWVFHWGAFSYDGAEADRDKELFLRATFRRGKTGRLSTPYWRVVSRDEVRLLTDRQFQ